MIRKHFLTAVVMAMIHLPTWAHATTYYVNNNGGDDDNNGQSAGAAWEHLHYAASQISSGDIVYVKATTIAYESFTVADSNVSFIGYTSTITDLNSGSGMPADYSEIYNTGSSRGFPNISLVSNCPRIDGGGRNSGTAVTISGVGNVSFKNFWVYNANIGVCLINADDCLLSNVYVFNCGGRDNSNHYDGRGIELTSGCTITFVSNCMCYNTGHVAFNIVGSDDNYILYSHALCDDDEYGRDCNTHYYFDVANNADGNVIYECTARRLHDPTAIGDDTLEHLGHGFVISAWHDAQEGTFSCEGNVIEQCETYDISDAFLVRGNVTDNEIVRCTAITNEGEEIDEDNEIYYAGGIVLNASPIANLFESVRVINANKGLVVAGSDLFYYDYRTATTCEDNVFYNCIFECNIYGIQLHPWPDESPDFDGNGFLNCNLIAMKSSANLFYLERESSDNLLVNCIIHDFDGFTVGTYDDDPIGFSTTYCLFSSNVGLSSSFTTGSGNIDNGVFAYVDGDWNISSNSDAYDAGTNISTYGTTDYDGDSRDGTYDIGAQEHIAP